MSDRNSLIGDVALTLREDGLIAALTALFGGLFAIGAAVTLHTFTNNAMLARRAATPSRARAVPGLIVAGWVERTG